MIGSLVDTQPDVKVAFCAPEEASPLIAAELERRLSPAEIELWRALASPKRRLDWACARLAAKKALGEGFEVLSEPSGRPYARRFDGAAVPAISLSHCAEGGACAVSWSGPVGIDYETVAEREPRVLELYAHACERPLLADAESQTALWCLKEAVLKLLGLGLAGGLTDARFASLEEPRPQLFGAAERGWRDLGRPGIRMSWRRQGKAIVALASGRQGA